MLLCRNGISHLQLFADMIVGSKRNLMAAAAASLRKGRKDQHGRAHRGRDRDRRRGARVRRPGRAACRTRARACQYLPREADRSDEGAGYLRARDPGALGRGTSLGAVLRGGDRGAGARLDEPGWGDGRAHGGRQADHRLRHAGAAGCLPAEDGDRADPRDDGADRARRRVGLAGDAHDRAT